MRARISANGQPAVRYLRLLDARYAFTAPSVAWRACSLSALFICALALRSPQLLLHPRLWAEEGAFYYNALQDGSVWTALTYTARGNYQLLINASVLLASKMPAALAAYVTTACALVGALIVICLLAVLSLQRGWRYSTVAVAVLIFAWFPSGYEIYLTSTNLQWLCSLSVLLLIILEPVEWTRTARFCASAWVACCAVTGVPSAMLAPVMAARGLRNTRSRDHLYWAVLLSLGAVVQLSIILTSNSDQRSFRIDPFVTAASLVSQAVLSPIAGVSLTEQVLAIMRKQASFSRLVLLLSLGVLPVYFAVRTLIREPVQSPLAFYVLAAALLSAVLNVFGAFGDPDALFSGWGGGRYFFLAGVCWVILLVALANSMKWPARAAGTVLLVAAAVAGVREIHVGTWKSFLTTGPSWKATVEACGEKRPCIVSVWPGGPDWSFELRRP